MLQNFPELWLKVLKDVDLFLKEGESFRLCGMYKKIFLECNRIFKNED